MRATLEFDSADTLQRAEFRDALHGGDMHAALSQLDTLLRNEAKYGEDPDIVDRAQWARDLLSEVLKDYNLEWIRDC